MSNSSTGPRAEGTASEAVDQEAQARHMLAQQNTVLFIRSLVATGHNWAEVTLLLTKTIKALKPKDTGAEARAAVADVLDPPGTIQERFRGWNLHMMTMLRQLFDAYEREIPNMIAATKSEVAQRGIAGADRVRADLEFMNEWTRQVTAHLQVITPGIDSVLLTVREAAAREAEAPPVGSQPSRVMEQGGPRMFRGP